ncbi:epoxyqueuosine reductase QueH [uncultured Megasphaera sp.]|uniref:epoxyqueuosine reductase QueH n=1 Tax=uncultured Megasphaera sp. TaxID=165188 RepID=UPI0025E7D498|nr:epoxyqueuosine reductase QueH [uncultured Megasphaera sp.]
MIDFHDILDRMNQNQRINFDKVFQRMARRWQQDGVKPRILLHSCCGPCSTAVLDRLTGVADVTVYYFNPNIHPEAEYRRRELVQKQFIEAYNKETGHDVHFLAAPYEPDTYFKAVQGLEDEPEGGARCRVCFIQRMKATAEKMQELGYDYFTTTLTVSPHKNSQVINEVGRQLEDEYGYSYLPTDFKKGNGYLKSTQMAAAYHLYRQPYCGCLFGARDQGLDLEEIRRDAEAFLAKCLPYSDAAARL